MGKYSKEDVVSILEDREFDLLDEYINTYTKIQMKCKKCGYLRVTKLSHVLSGHGCKNCKGNLKLTPNKIKSILNKNKLVLLDEYKNNKSPLKIQCRVCNYIWFPTISNIISNKSGCPQCSNKKPYNLCEIKNIITSKNGMLLSNKYYNVFSKLNVKCLTCDIIWHPTLKSILSGNWCPNCADTTIGKEQNKLYTILCDIFTTDVYQNYKGFDWLITPDTKKRIEIDIWIPSVKLAIEYDGEQHFRAIDFFGGEKTFKRQQKLDKYKNKLIKESNIVKYFVRFDYTEKMDKEYIITKLNKIIPPTS